ncbi:DUF4381 domain-containing protein [Ruegeria arenilitoris]|uniref:DUF4381 domain-containing protein n=1 Tax=Ruegeria arenilitoris TaxID=1173585 RepID=UPI00147AAF0D|nr:DUF4381 domain-containing protein [Ruegeria arenilitoris]
MSVDVEGKSLVELLDMLEPAPTPAPVPMTPQTWGWAVLALLLVAAIACAVHLYRRHRKSNAYRRTALADLQAADSDVARIAEVLRRTALAAFPRDQVAGLHGPEWITFLKQSADKISISSADAQALVDAPYRPSLPNPNVAKFARDWIRTHKAPRRQ